uniref:Uncharacterized protein n=1 Tax=Arundo donax TaxID=35708 RepID=A0A0A8Y4H5_ARUDO
MFMLTFRYKGNINLSKYAINYSMPPIVGIYKEKIYFETRSEEQ